MITIEIGDLYLIKDVENSDWNNLVGIIEDINDIGEIFLWTVMHPYWNYVIRPHEISNKLIKV